jgi:hypothetical protein
VFRNFPLAQLHPEAESAAETAEFAGAHGHFVRSDFMGGTTLLAVVTSTTGPTSSSR